jgi:hypothetical protein
MSLIGIVLIVVLVLILFGGIGPHFYTGTPWRAGYGFGAGGVSVIGLILIIVLILALSGRF